MNKKEVAEFARMQEKIISIGESVERIEEDSKEHYHAHDKKLEDFFTKVEDMFDSHGKLIAHLTTKSKAKDVKDSMQDKLIYGIITFLGSLLIFALSYILK